MGLDMYAVTVPATGDLPAIVTTSAVFKAEPKGLCYWRKHPNLHGWIEHLWKERGGTGEFNLTYVRLLPEDLIALRDAVTKDSLPTTRGFFFGESYRDEESRAYDLDFIDRAEAAIADGQAVYYYSWW